jgi:hypothetical protein
VNGVAKVIPADKATSTAQSSFFGELDLLNNPKPLEITSARELGDAYPSVMIEREHRLIVPVSFCCFRSGDEQVVDGE